MKAFLLTLFSLLVIGSSVIAQSPGFRFGPRLGIGTSRFVGLPESCAPGTSLQASAIGSWQLKRFFAIEFSPATTIYGGQFKMVETNGANARGIANVYPYRDIYHIYAVEFPVLVKFSIGKKKTHLYGCFGAGLAYTMGGTHSKKYDDPTYNAGFMGHEMRDIKDSYYFGIAGTGLEFEMKKGILGFDLRTQRTKIIGGVEGVPFSARELTLGISWKLKSAQ